METVDLLRAEGIRYIGDWVFDDQPVSIRTEHGELIAMPYTVELNDIPMMAVQHHESEVFLQRVKDSFDCLYQEGGEHVRVMGIAVHPFLSGVPHRIKYVEQALQYILDRPGVRCMTGRQILDWYLAQNA